jgi:hypothetical protein
METINMDSKLRAVPQGMTLVFRKPNGRKFHILATYYPSSVKAYCMSEWDEMIDAETIPEWREIPENEIYSSPIMCKTCIRRESSWSIDSHNASTGREYGDEVDDEPELEN